jgi:hypothetical protein
VETPPLPQPRRYFSARTGLNPNAVTHDLPTVKRLFLSVYESLEREGYFQEAFGYDCVDAGGVFGYAGTDIQMYFFRRLKKADLWPISRQRVIDDYSEDDLFDVIELLFDEVSKPVNGSYHSWSECGWHYTTFTKKPGQVRFRQEINEVLAGYREGWELSRAGEILALGDTGLRNLLTKQLPRTGDPQSVEAR